MKKIVILLALISLTFSIYAQNNIKDFTLTKDSVMYKVLKANPQGQQVKEGDVIIGKFSIFFGDSLVYNGMSRPSQPLFGVTRQNNMFKGDLMDALLLMHQGETMTFAFSKSSMKKVQANLHDFKGDYVFYTVQLDSLTTIKAMEEIQKKQMEAQKHIVDSLKAIETANIHDFLIKNDWDKKPVDGIYLHKIKDGVGKIQAQNGDNVNVNYTGRFLDGRVFDTSIDSIAKANNIYQKGRTYNPLEFKLGEHRVVAGFEAAVKQMKQGDIMEVLIPSSLAYGERGAGKDIPPCTPLIFTLEMVSFEK